MNRRQARKILRRHQEYPRLYRRYTLRKAVRKSPCRFVELDSPGMPWWVPEWPEQLTITDEVLAEEFCRAGKLKLPVVARLHGMPAHMMAEDSTSYS